MVSVQITGIVVMLVGSGLTWGWTGVVAGIGLAMLLTSIAAELKR